MRDLLEIYQTTETTRRMAELHELVQPTLEELARTLGYQRAFVALINQEEDILEGAVGVNVPDDLLQTLPIGRNDPGPMVQALRQGRPMRVDDALRDPRIPESRRAYYTDFGMLSFAAIPLLPASGVLVVSKDRPLTEAEINELLPYAGRITAAVAERREAQRARESGEQHAVEKEWLWWMVNAVQDPILLTDDQQNVVFNNIHAERLLRASLEDSPAKVRAIDLNNLLLSASLSSFSLDQGASLGREVTLVDPIEGTELHFDIISREATNLRTGERGLVWVLKDVTDLRRADVVVRRSVEEFQTASERVQRERDRLNLILENVADPIVVTNPEGQIILMNNQAERLLQPDPRAGMETMYLANEAKFSSFLLQLTLQPDPVRHGELELVAPDTGESLTMNVTATEARDALGQVTAVVSVLHDLTKIRELERKTVQQQLFESEKLAAIGRLAAQVAHEINNPLEAIKNALYLVLNRTPEGDRNRQFLEIASKETDRVSDLIREMLGLHRRGGVKTSTEVNQILEEVIALLERQLRQRRVELRCEFDQHLPTVLVSADQLKQVFLNLFINAQEAMPGGGTLYVTTRLSRETDAEFPAGQYVLIQFRDTGTGISEEHLPRIFEPFYSTKTDSKGTGLGLWVSLNIIEEYGGQLKVRSRPGRGTTFTIALSPEDGK